MRVAIIGAGITGLYLAWDLTKKNNNVIVYEKEGKPGGKACSGLFSKKILDFIPESKTLVENKIDYVLVHFPKKTIRIDFADKFLVINHSRLDYLMYEKAKKEGAEIKFNCEINSPYFINSPKTSGDFDKIIGCEGAHSFTRETLNLSLPSFRLGILGFVKKASFENFVEVWPCHKGFIWKIPRGKSIEYGIIAKPEEAKNILDGFLKKRSIKLNNLSARVISQGLDLPSEKSITVCGEAAGLTKPWTGGGVIWSLTAARFLTESFPDFIKYKTKVESFFPWRIRLGKVAEAIFRFLGFHLPWLLPKRHKLDSDFLVKK